MQGNSSTPSAVSTTVKTSWLPLIVILLAQIQMGMNVNAIPISIGGIVYDFETSPTSVGSALVVYSLAVAAFVLLGAKLGKLIGPKIVFQITVLLHGAAMALMALSADETAMINAQFLAGLAAAALVPTLVMLITDSYRGQQQSQAIGLLAGAPAVSSVLAFMIAGPIGTFLNWRYSFGLLIIVAGIVFLLSFRLKPVARQADVKIDTVGATLAALAIIFISMGFNNLKNWGALLAGPNSPLSLFGISLAPIMIVVGVIVGQAFLEWTHLRQSTGRSPLLSLEVIDSHKERSALYAFLMISAIGPAVNFLIPLYIQIVQGRSSLQTSISIIPYAIAIFVSALFVIQLYRRLTPRNIARAAFVLVAAGLALLAFTIQNDWGTPGVILGLLVLGAGEGALLTLLFNVLITASPKELSGDVGALRGVANNLSTGLGTAFAGILAVGLLSSFIMNSLLHNPTLPPELQVQVPLDSINFVSDDHLREVLSETSADQEQVDLAVQINETGRVRALKTSFFILAGIAMLAILPTSGLPDYIAADEEAVSDQAASEPVGED